MTSLAQVATGRRSHAAMLPTISSVQTRLGILVACVPGEIRPQALQRLCQFNVAVHATNVNLARQIWAEQGIDIPGGATRAAAAVPIYEHSGHAAVSGITAPSVEIRGRRRLVTGKKSVENLLDIGHSLDKIKEMLPHPIFLAHIKASLGLGEMQASRLIALYRKFGSAGSSKVLEAKPSVLYLLATAKDLDKVEALAGGGKVLVSGKRNHRPP